MPSRDEAPPGPAVAEEEPEILTTDLDGTTVETEARSVIRGGRGRGIILHKLIEEVLTGETEELTPEMTARAEALIRQIGSVIADDPAEGLTPAEIAGSAARALALPEIVDLRPRLLPEVPVYASIVSDGKEEVTAGMADAIAFGPDGEPLAVVDWKSDVDPTPETLEHYRAQVRAYLDMTGVDRGLIILATSGMVIPVFGGDATVG